MNTRHFKKFFLFAFLGLLLAIFPLYKAQATELNGPQLAIEKASSLLKQRLQDETLAKNFPELIIFVDQTIRPLVDFRRISALVLGKLWRKATDEEKQQFTAQFKTLLVRTYSRAFYEFKEWTVEFLPLIMEEGAKKIIVKTEIIQPGIQPLSVNYRMINSKGEWKVYDILIEGVSLVTNYRTSIKNEYKRVGSLQGLIDQLAKRNQDAMNKIQTET